MAVALYILSVNVPVPTKYRRLCQCRHNLHTCGLGTADCDATVWGCERLGEWGDWGEQWFTQNFPGQAGFMIISSVTC